MKRIARKVGSEGSKDQPPSSSGTGGISISTLSLPTAASAKQHLGSKKKSDTKDVHPGYSLFEWTRLCNSTPDMPGTKGKLLRVTPEEMARHSTDKDLWLAVRGVVYNVTLFTKYHPGGKARLMRVAGKDCTEIFDKIHVWVNSEAILEKCRVGYLVGFKTSAKPTSLSVSIEKPVFAGDSNQDDGVDVFSIQVPMLSIGDTRSLGYPEEEDSDVDQALYTTSRHSAAATSPSTGISIPVPRNLANKNPTSSTEIFIPVPRNLANSNPTSSTVISIPVPSRTNQNSMSHITDHPLISKTAYETAV